MIQLSIGVFLHVHSQLWKGLASVEGERVFVLNGDDCGEQLKLTCILSGVLTNLIIYRNLDDGKKHEIKWLKVLGDNSFGIYFSHMAIIVILNLLFPNYKSIFLFPLNALIILALSNAFVWGGRKLLGKNSGVMAL